MNGIVAFEKVNQGLSAYLTQPRCTMFARQAISRHAQFSLAIAIATSSFITDFVLPTISLCHVLSSSVVVIY